MYQLDAEGSEHVSQKDGNLPLQLSIALKIEFKKYSQFKCIPQRLPRTFFYLH